MHPYVPRPSLNFFPVPVPNFGSWVHRRRLVLGLSPTRAAALADIDKADWDAIEQGWLPDADTKVWRSLAATLQVKFDDLDCAVDPVAMHFESAQDF
jgi:hypothetical protein